MEKGERTSLHKRILKLTNDLELEEEIKVNAYKAAPHELNSKIIDVDKLDYLLRDSYMPMMPKESGYKITLSFCMMHILEKMH